MADIIHESGIRNGEMVCFYNDYQKFGDRMLARSYECDEDKHPRIEARVDELTATPETGPTFFTPPDGAKESVNCLDSIKPPKVLSAPNLPPPTQSFSGTIMVLVTTAIGTDGKPHNLKVTSEPRMPFDETALAEVQQYRFMPARCGGEPIETEIVVQVAFTHY